MSTQKHFSNEELERMTIQYSMMKNESESSIDYYFANIILKLIEDNKSRETTIEELQSQVTFNESMLTYET